MTWQLRSAWTRKDKRRPSVVLRAVIAAVFYALAPSAASADLILDLQAEFILRFPMFIEWPANSTVGNSSKPFVIGVFGNDDLFDALRATTKQTRIKAKRVELRKIYNLSGLDYCQIVFVAGSKDDQLPEILDHLSGKPILTIGATPKFAEQGVMINFKTEGETIRFELNDPAAATAGLRFASQFLALGDATAKPSRARATRTPNPPKATATATATQIPVPSPAATPGQLGVGSADLRGP